MSSSGMAGVSMYVYKHRNFLQQNDGKAWHRLMMFLKIFFWKHGPSSISAATICELVVVAASDSVSNKSRGLQRADMWVFNLWHICALLTLPRFLTLISPGRSSWELFYISKQNCTQIILPTESQVRCEQDKRSTFILPSRNCCLQLLLL